MRLLLLTVVAFLTLTNAALADDVTSAGPEISFVHQGGIFDWRAEGTRAILIESLQHKYYRATFAVPCEKLPYTEDVAFETDPGDKLTKFDAIHVGREDCFFETFTEVPKPPGFPH